MDSQQLEARAAAAERAQTVAPPDVSGQLRATAHAEADAWQQAADAQANGDETGANNAQQLAGLLSTECRTSSEKAAPSDLSSDYGRRLWQIQPDDSRLLHRRDLQKTDPKRLPRMKLACMACRKSRPPLCIKEPPQVRTLLPTGLGQRAPLKLRSLSDQS
jgi:hypothetical protein